MAKLSEYLQYQDSSLFLWRSGDLHDPYIDKTDNLRIVNNRAVLDEVPDQFNRVVIEGMTEIVQEVFGYKKHPDSNEYFVDYANGIVTFNESLNGQSRVAVYKGRGKILIPATRIWVNSDNPYAVDNLQELIDGSIEKMQELDLKQHQVLTFMEQKFIEYNQKVDDRYNEYIVYLDDRYQEYTQYVEERYIDLTEIISNAVTATDQAQAAAEYGSQMGDYAKNQGDRVDNLIVNSLLILNNCEQATEDAIEAKEQADLAAEGAIYARNTTILIWKEPVDNFGELSARYPDPEVGWTSMTLDSGRRYRWDGLRWLEIDNFTTGAIPLVNENVNGLMSIEDYLKLQDISGEIDDELLDEVRTKTIVFVLADKLLHGSQGIVIKFPHDGEFISVDAFLRYEGATDTKIRVEKTSSSDFDQFGAWASILNQELTIVQYERSNTSNDFISNIVNKNDYFRIVLVEEGIDARDLTIQINIKVKK